MILEYLILLNELMNTSVLCFNSFFESKNGFCIYKKHQYYTYWTVIILYSCTKRRDLRWHFSHMLWSMSLWVFKQFYLNSSNFFYLNTFIKIICACSVDYLTKFFCFVHIFWTSRNLLLQALTFSQIFWMTIN